MPKYVNPHAVPQPIVDAIIQYEEQERGSREHFWRSATELADAPRQQLLCQRHDSEIEIDVATCLPALWGQAYLMRRTLHPKIKGETWTFECKACGKQTEKSVLH